MKADVVQHRAERIVRVVTLRRGFDGLGDRNPERAGGVARIAASRVRELARRAVDGCAPRLHHRAPVGLLVIARPDHEHLAFQAEQRARERER